MQTGAIQKGAPIAVGKGCRVIAMKSSTLAFRGTVNGQTVRRVVSLVFGVDLDRLGFNVKLITQRRRKT